MEYQVSFWGLDVENQRRFHAEFSSLPVGSIYTFNCQEIDEDYINVNFHVLSENPESIVSDFFQGSTPVWTYFRKE
jgi:hypothetical protein